MKNRMNVHQIYEDAIDVFGDGPQQIKTIEELAELQVALAKDMNDLEVTQEEIIDELADAYIMIKQMAIVFGEDQVIQRIAEKVERLKKMVDAERELL